MNFLYEANPIIRHSLHNCLGMLLPVMTMARHWQWIPKYVHIAGTQDSPIYLEIFPRFRHTRPLDSTLTKHIQASTIFRTIKFDWRHKPYRFVNSSRFFSNCISLYRTDNSHKYRRSYFLSELLISKSSSFVAQNKSQCEFWVRSVRGFRRSVTSKLSNIYMKTLCRVLRAIKQYRGDPAASDYW